MGRSFLILTSENRKYLCINIVKVIENHKDDLNQDLSRKDFLCKYKDDTAEEIISYNKIIEYLQNQENEED